MLKPEFQTKYDQCVEALEKLGVSVADFRQLLDESGDEIFDY